MDKKILISIVVLAIFSYSSTAQQCNIDQLVDRALNQYWPQNVNSRVMNLKLPDILNERINIGLVSTHLNLNQGYVRTVFRPQRLGNAFVRPDIKNSKLHINVDFLVKQSELQYVFKSTTLHVHVNGNGVGLLKNSKFRASITYDFKNSRISLDNLSFIQFGDLSVTLKDVGVFTSAADSVKNHVTNILRARLTQKMTNFIKNQLNQLLNVLNTNQKRAVLLEFIQNLLKKCNYGKYFRG